jgi:hypothetical protein
MGLDRIYGGAAEEKAISNGRVERSALPIQSPSSLSGDYAFGVETSGGRDNLRVFRE